MFDDIWDESIPNYHDSERFQHPLYEHDEEHGYKGSNLVNNSRQISNLLNDVDDMTIRTYRTRGSKEPLDTQTSWRSSTDDNLSGLFQAVDDMTLSTRTITNDRFPQHQARSRRSLSVPVRKAPSSSDVSLLLREADEMTFTPLEDSLSVTNAHDPTILNLPQQGRSKRSSSVPVKKAISSEVSIMLREADEMTFKPLRNIPVRPMPENLRPLPATARNRPPQAPQRTDMALQQKKHEKLTNHQKDVYKRPDLTPPSNEKQITTNNRQQRNVDHPQRKGCIGCLSSAKFRYALTAVCVSLVAGCAAFIAAMTLYPTFFDHHLV